jgi:hypothetical protein
MYEPCSYMIFIKMWADFQFSYLAILWTGHLKQEEYTRSSQEKHMQHTPIAGRRNKNIPTLGRYVMNTDRTVVTGQKR